MDLEKIIIQCWFSSYAVLMCKIYYTCKMQTVFLGLRF